MESFVGAEKYVCVTENTTIKDGPKRRKGRRGGWREKDIGGWRNYYILRREATSTGLFVLPSVNT